MEKPGKRLVSRRVMCYEAAGFLFVILIIWLNELIDIPYLCLGAEQTPVNWRESLFETVLNRTLFTRHFQSASNIASQN